MNNVLEDFIYSLETMETRDLAAHGLDDVWLAELSEDELIAFIHEAIKRLPEDEDPFSFELGEEYEEEQGYDE